MVWLGRGQHTLHQGNQLSRDECSPEAPGADASIPEHIAQGQHFHTASPRPQRSWLASRLCCWHSQIGFNSRDGGIILSGLYLNPQSSFHKSYQELLSSADGFQVLIWMRAGDLAVKPFFLC